MSNGVEYVTLILFFVTIVISLIFLILNLVWLFRVMNNSKKGEPPQEKRLSLLIINTNDYLDYGNNECIKRVEPFIEDGVYSTFNFKMKQINKFSKGLISINFIDMGLVILTIIFTIIFSFIDKEKEKIILRLYKILDCLSSVLYLIFFIITSVFYYEGKTKEFENFGKCELFDKENFNKTYEYIFIVYDNYFKVFVVSLISFSFSLCSILLRILCRNERK